jgi:hypothetical protein
LDSDNPGNSDSNHSDYDPNFNINEENTMQEEGQGDAEMLDTNASPDTNMTC